MRKYDARKTHWLVVVCTFCISVCSVSAQWYNNCSSDSQPPVAICEGHTVVSLGSDGTAKLYATSIDDGSYDNCELAGVEIARMDEGWCEYGVNDGTSFGLYTEFCCEDLGYPVRVILRAKDTQGNTNECMVDVTVQDKLAPTIHCPYDKTIACDYWYSEHELYNQNSTVFGSAWATDNCGLEDIHVDVEQSTSCNSGKIQRIFTAVDWGGTTSTCTQWIWVSNSYGFSEHNITWPWDYESTGCHEVDTDPESLPPGYDRPTWSDAECSMIAAAYEDLEFKFVDDVCTKILRKWTVIDWCQYDPYSVYHSSGIWEHTQLIKLKDSEHAEFWNCEDTTLTVIGETCGGDVVLDPEVIDYCTPADELVYEYKIDKYANGTIDIVRYDQPILDEFLPYGTHKVSWFVDDGCGNLATCSYYVTVEDGKPPTPSCLGLYTAIMPIGGMVTVWAKDFDASSDDNCTPVHELKFSFGPDTQESSYVFDCDHIGTNYVDIYVTDESGNQNYCTVPISVADNESQCMQMNPLSGFVTTHTGTPVAAAALELYKVMPDESMQSDRVDMSDGQGFYTSGFGTTQFNRMLSATREAHMLEGISIIDLRLIQQHIVGVQRILDPATLYAADIDASGEVNIMDLLILRNGLLSGGITLDRSGIDLDWMFYPAGCDWNNMDPDCNLMYEIDRANPPVDVMDFIGIKKGDLNGDLLGQVIQGRDATVNNISIIPVKNKYGTALQFVAQSDFEDVDGLQLSVTSKAFQSGSLTQVLSGALDITLDETLLMNEMARLNVVWSSGNKVSLSMGDVLFTVLIDNNSLRDKAFQSVDPLGSQYQNQVLTGEEAQIVEVNFAVADRTVISAPIQSVQLNISPNPVTEAANVTFVTELDAEYELTVYTTDSRIVESRVVRMVSGVNTVSLPSSVFATPGLYYVQLSNDASVHTGKVIKVD